MRKHFTFFAGFLTAILICVCATTAFAASGSISFNGAEVRLGGYTVLRENEYLTTEKGANIPSTLLYRDTSGETTCYVPVDAFVKALDMSAFWLKANEIVSVKLPVEMQVYGMSTSQEGSVCNNILEEIAPVSDAVGKKLVDVKQYKEKDGKTVTCTLPLVKNNGDYISITITNNGDRVLKFGLGVQRDGGNAMISTQIPAGKTVTRTVKILNAQAVSETPIVVSVSPTSEFIPNVDVTISAVQFKNASK